MLSSWVVDDQGEAWPEASRNLGLALQTRRQGADLTDFLVHQMGFVVVREYANRYEVKSCLETTSPVALTALFLWFQQRALRPVVYTDVADTKINRVLRDKKSLNAYLNALIEARSRRPDFVADRIEIDLSPFSASWQRCTDLCRADIPLQRKFELIEQLHQHFTFAERDENGEYVVTYASGVARDYDPAFLSRDHGTFAEASDRAFGKWSADHFRRLNVGTDPFAESVGAVATFHARPRQRYFYNRLIVPITVSPGRDALLITVANVDCVGL